MRLFGNWSYRLTVAAEIVGVHVCINEIEVEAEGFARVLRTLHRHPIMANTYTVVEAIIPTVARRRQEDCSAVLARDFSALDIIKSNPIISAIVKQFLNLA